MAFEDTKSQNSENSDNGKDFEMLRNSRRVQRNESISKHNQSIQ